MRLLSLADVALASSRPANHAVACVREEPVTQRQWSQLVAAWAREFEKVEGSDIGLYFDDALAFSAALWGAWHAGKVAVLAADLQPHTVAKLQSSVHACAGLLPGSLSLPSPSSDEALPALEALSLEKSRVVLFTSGSTGEPERIDKSLSQLNAEVKALESAFGGDLGHSAALRLHATVSHQHIYGLLFRVLWPLGAGRALGVSLLQYPEQIVEQLQRGEACALITSPALLGRLPDHLAWHGARQSLCMVFSSGGPLPELASIGAQTLLGQSPTEVFGSSETGGIAWRRRAESQERWTPLPGVEVRLSDEGLLSVRSGHLPAGQGWWDTADRALPLGDGAGFVLQGRADRIAKIAEKRVSLTALERCLEAHDWVDIARAVVLDAAHTGQRVGMVLALSEAGWAALHAQGRRKLAATLRAVLAPSTERVALPRSWRYVVRLPMNAQSKTTQHDLLRLFNPLMPLPVWTQRDVTQAVAVVPVQPELRVLEGHFPGVTLMPGVAQLHWVVTLGMQAFGLAATFARAELLKFQHPIVPGDSVEVRLQWLAEKQHLQFSIVSARGLHASGRLVQTV